MVYMKYSFLMVFLHKPEIPQQRRNQIRLDSKKTCYALIIYFGKNDAKIFLPVYLLNYLLTYSQNLKVDKSIYNILILTKQSFK